MGIKEDILSSRSLIFSKFNLTLCFFLCYKSLSISPVEIGKKSTTSRSKQKGIRKDGRNFKVKKRILSLKIRRRG
jgi:hypothetical protein